MLMRVAGLSYIFLFASPFLQMYPLLSFLGINSASHCILFTDFDLYINIDFKSSSYDFLIALNFLQQSTLERKKKSYSFSRKFPFMKSKDDKSEDGSDQERKLLFSILQYVHLKVLFFMKHIILRRNLLSAENRIFLVG